MAATWHRHWFLDTTMVIKSDGHATQLSHRGRTADHRYFSDDAMIVDQIMTGTVTGVFLGLPGNGRRISFRILHVFEFRERPDLPRERLARRRRDPSPADRLNKPQGVKPLHPRIIPVVRDGFSGSRTCDR